MRIASRVREGGHDIPENVVRRRFASGLRNFFHLYMPLADGWMCYDNSGDVPRRVAHQQREKTLVIEDAATWRVIQEMAQ